jgi:hypothetical protein
MTQQELEIKDRQSNDRLNIAKEKIQLAREKQNKRKFIKHFVRVYISKYYDIVPPDASINE